MGPAAAWTNDAVLDGVVAGAGRGAMGLGRRLYRTGDQKGLEGVVNGLGVSALWSAARVRLAQSGNVQLYAGAMFVGVVVLAVAFAVGGN
jgi:NADH:ubiquinone oxidoreductase subunit 5 (subunit L)/multisubunit Na+/H+ antiporter MnhA subunit